jgi:hypothetical protein
MNYTRQLEQHVEELQEKLTHAHDVIHMHENKEKLLKNSYMYCPFYVRVVRFDQVASKLDTKEERYGCIDSLLLNLSFLTLDKRVVAIHITKYGLFSKLVFHTLAFPPEVALLSTSMLSSTEKKCNHKTFAFYVKYSGDPILDAMGGKYIHILDHNPTAHTVTHFIDLHEILKKRYQRRGDPLSL